MNRKIRKDKRKIPKGYYCYSPFIDSKKGYKLVGICPYWSKRKNKPKQSCGYCAYLEKGDWNINAQAEVELIYCKGNKPKEKVVLKGKEIPFPVGLLWDMVKECGIKE